MTFGYIATHHAAALRPTTKHEHTSEMGQRTSAHIPTPASIYLEKTVEILIDTRLQRDAAWDPTQVLSVGHDFVRRRLIL